jgi:hypothetical protein
MKLDVITRSINQSILKTKKNSPHIFFGAGIIASITSTVLACRATLKLEDVLDEIEEQFDAIDADCNHTDDMSSNEYNKMLWRARLDGAKKLLKLYGPTVLSEIVAIGLLSGSHVQMSKKNSMLMAALVAVSKGHENYRDNVAEEVGKEKGREVYSSTFIEKTDWNAFTRIFDEGSSNYHKDAEINREFLHFIQERANLKLRTQGVVFLNEVYDMLGFERTRMGHIYGWVYGGDGLNEIDFGIFEGQNSRFINGLERAVILNFNVDGPLHEYI